MPIEQLAGEDVFAARALSVLLQRVGDSTRDLAGLRASIERAALDPRGQAGADGLLGSVCARVEQQGWLFGLVARELGSDVLFERRERNGLRTALQLVGEMLAAEQRPFEPAAVPELEGCDARATDLCAVVARCVYAAHAEQTGGRWSFQCAQAATWLCFEAPRADALERELLAGAARLPGSRLTASGQRWRLLLPPNCVSWP